MPKVVKSRRVDSVEPHAKSEARCWMVTILNWTELDWPWDEAKSAELFRYAIVGKETCPTTGTPHMQCYVVFHKKKRFNPVKALFPRADLRVARGTPTQCRDYCAKDGDFVEMGELPPSSSAPGGAANKARYEAAWESAKLGDLDAVPADLRLKHYRTLKQIAVDYAALPEDAEGTTGLWIWGPTGVGKSRYAREQHPDFYAKRPNKWWDSYQGQETVLLEDLDPSHAFLGHDLKIWMDRYAFPGETKGGHVMLRPKLVVVTSQYPPEAVFPDTETVAALRRRMKVLHMAGTGVINSIQLN